MARYPKRFNFLGQREYHATIGIWPLPLELKVRIYILFSKSVVNFN